MTHASLFTALTAASLLLGPGTAAAAEEPRAVVERGVEAVGGRQALAQSRAVLSRLSGVVYEPDGSPFVAELYTQYPDRFRLRLVISPNTPDQAVHLQILDHDQVYYRINDEDEDVDALEMQLSAYVDNVASLLPLLEETGFKLSAAGEIEVGGKRASGVRVSAEGRPDVLLYFDKTTGLLVKTDYRRPAHGNTKESHKEEFLSDYREVDLTSAELRTLKAAGVADDDASLLAYLRERTMPEERRTRIQALIRKLADASFEAREAAQAELNAQGPPALPLLARAANDSDPEVARRARECRDKIGKSPDMAAPAAVARLLALRRPQGAAEVLLAYLPSAPDDGVARDVRSALASLAAAGGAGRTALERARSDPSTERRTAAERALAADAGKSDGTGERVFPKGLRHATSGVEFRDGKKVVEWKLTDAEFYRRFDDAVFARPPAARP